MYQCTLYSTHTCYVHLLAEWRMWKWWRAPLCLYGCTSKWWLWFAKWKNGIINFLITTVVSVYVCVNARSIICTGAVLPKTHMIRLMHAVCGARTINTLITTRYIMLFGMCFTAFPFVWMCAMHTPLVCGYCTNIFRIYDFSLLFTRRDTSDKKRRTKSRAKSTHGQSSSHFSRSMSFYHVFCRTQFSFVLVCARRAYKIRCVCVVCGSIARENLQTTR